MASVLVTAASGNVGRHCVRACLAAGLPVVSALRAPDIGQGPAVTLDFTDRETWRPALRGVKSLFLVRPPAIADMANTLVPFIDLAIEMGVRDVVFLSVLGAERMSWVPHRTVEKHLAHASVGFTLLRPGFFAQNVEDAYLRDIVEDRRIYVPAGDAKVAFIDARDIGEVAAKVLATPAPYRKQVLTLTGPAAIRFDEAASAISKSLGATIRYEPATVGGYAWHLWRRRQLALTQVAVQTVLHTGLRRGDAEAVTSDVKDVLGREATAFADYARYACDEGKLAR